MNVPPRFPLWSWLTAAVVGTVFLLLLARPNLWRGLGVGALDFPFADTVAILAAGEARQLGYDVYVGNPLDPIDRAHVYGPGWLVTGRLGLRAVDAWWIGGLLGLTFVAVAVWQVRPQGPREALGVALLLLSPPFALAVERGNNDLVVFLLLVAAAWAVTGEARSRGWVGATLVLVAGALKIYPLVAALGLAARRAPATVRVALVAFPLLGFAALYALQSDEFGRALAAAPRPYTIFAHGLPLLLPFWHALEWHRAYVVLGFVPPLVLGSILLARGWRSWWETLVDGQAAAALAVMCGVAWFGCYLMIPNFPYRLVLLLPLFAGAWRGEQGRTGIGVALLLLTGLWAAAPKQWFAEAASNESARAGHLVAWCTGWELATWLVVAAAIALSLTGWAVRTARAAR